MSKLTTVGDRVKLKHKTKELVGIVKFIGSIKGKNGTYYGIELDTANTGDNNGSIQNIQYFSTSRRKGLFIKKSAITKTNSKNNKAPRVTVGTKVTVTKFDCQGTIRFIGELQSKAGIWFGVDLGEQKGTNNGIHKGREYFKCNDKHGVFLRENGFETAKSSYNIVPKKKEKQNNVSVPSQNDIKRREDIEKVVNVLNGTGAESDLNHVITSYDDKKDSEDIEWLKIIATLKSIHDGNNKRENEINQLKADRNSTHNSNNGDKAVERELMIQIHKLKNQLELRSSEDNDHTNQVQTELEKSREELKRIKMEHDERLNAQKEQYIQQMDALKEDINELKRERDGNTKQTQQMDALQKEISTLKTDKRQSETQYESQIKSLKEEIASNNNNRNGNDFERRLKFEKEELTRQYESQIKTLHLDKQRLEKQLLSQGISPLARDEVTEKKEDKSIKIKVEVNVEELMKEKEQLQVIIRAKDDIINNAKQEIDKLRTEIAELREEEQKEEVQLDRLSRDRAKQLLEKRVSDQQQNSLNQVQQEIGKKKTISELLADCDKEDAVDIIHSMGVIKFEYDKKLKADTYNLDLTNNSVLRRLTNDQRNKWMFLLAHCICDSSGQQKIQKLKMSNMGIDDKLFPDFMDILIEKIDHFVAEEWSLESNKIGNKGMEKLSEFLNLAPKSLEIVKMYNNKTLISTQVINELLTSIENNGALQKFTFEWRLTQHRDRIEKQLKKNQDEKRRRKWMGK